MNSLLLSILVIFTLSSIAYGQDKPVVVSVYYESLCPDSRRFINNQLFPTFQKFGGVNKFFSIDFLPYGKAETFKGEDGQFEFECHHGPRECEGNMVQLCGLYYFPLEVQAAFINCSIASIDPPNSGPECSEALGLEFSHIEHCIESYGNELMNHMGERTHSLNNPPLYYVPWIMFDHLWTEEDMRDSEANFLQVICDKIGHAAEACDELKKL